MTTTAGVPAKETLFSLTGDLLALDELLTESGGELTPEIESLLAEYRDKFTSKIDGLGWYWRTLEAKALLYGNAAEEMAAKEATEKNKIKRLKEYAAACLAQLGTTKAAGEVYTLALQKNGGVPPLELQEPYKSEPHRLPEQFRTEKVLVSANMLALRAAAEAAGGEAIIEDYSPDAGPGGETEPFLVARILPVGTHVRLR